MKTIYFVRHEETDSNVRQVHGHHTDFLSERGQLRVTFVADSLLEAEIEIIISSPYVRALQTVEAISGTFGKSLVLKNILGKSRGSQS